MNLEKKQKQETCLHKWEYSSTTSLLENYQDEDVKSGKHTYRHYDKYFTTSKIAICLLCGKEKTVSFHEELIDSKVEVIKL